MATNDGKKSRLRAAAIAALMTSTSVASAAAKAGVSESTLARWQRDPEFAGELTRAQDAAIEQTARNLAALAPGAIAAIAAALSQHEPTSVRLSGARLALDQLANLTELANLTRRLDALEARFNSESTDPT